MVVTKTFTQEFDVSILKLEIKIKKFPGKNTCYNETTKILKLFIDIDSGKIVNWKHGLEQQLSLKTTGVDIFLYDNHSGLLFKGKLNDTPEFLSKKNQSSNIINIDITNKGYIKNWDFSVVQKWINKQDNLIFVN